MIYWTHLEFEEAAHIAAVELYRKFQLRSKAARAIVDRANGAPT